MSASAALAPDAVLRNYFHAKDENRPHMLDRVFTEGALLEVKNNANTIAFPAVTSGRTEIANVLVRAFGQTYENVYSFYLQRPHASAAKFDCDWIVAMTAKTSLDVRVGCGSYEWTFAPDPPHLANRLIINIAAMHVLPPTAAPTVLLGVGELTYPWSSRVELERVAARYAPFDPLLQHLTNR